MTIESSREIDVVFRKGRRYSTPQIIALIATTPEGRGPSGRVAFIAGKKLGSAVKRNRSKRVLRETARRSAREWDGRDVVLIARETTSSATPEALDRALASILDKAGVR